MIIVVIVAFSLITISYLFVSSSVETIIKNKIKESISTEENYIYDPGHNKLSKQIQELREMIEKLHKEDTNGFNKKNQ